MPTIMKRMRATLVREGYDLGRLDMLNETEMRELLKAITDKILGPNTKLCPECRFPYIQKKPKWTCMQVDCVHPCPCRKNKKKRKWTE